MRFRSLFAAALVVLLAPGVAAAGRSEDATPPVEHALAAPSAAAAAAPSFPGVAGVDLLALGYEGLPLDGLVALSTVPSLPADPIEAAIASSSWLVQARTLHGALSDAVAVLDTEVARLDPLVGTGRLVVDRASGRHDHLAADLDRTEAQVRDRIAALGDRRDLLAEAAVAAYVRPPDLDVVGAMLRGEANAVDTMAAGELFSTRIEHDLVVEHQLRVEVAMLAERLDGMAGRLAELEAEHASALAELETVEDRRDAHALALVLTRARLDELSLGLLAMEGIFETVFADAVAAVGGGVAGIAPGSIPTVRVEGIVVHAAIAAPFQAMVQAARADGIDLIGWGFRSHQRQIELRKAHCGETDVEIWLTPPGECRPPTAIPGTSRHEVGLAIDFAGVSTRSHPVFVWLAEHAADYGFFNLPSEPWHWSVDGR